MVDPIKGRKGWFYSKKGKIEKFKHEVDTDRPRLGVSATDSAANIGAKLGGGGVSLKTVIAISAVMSLLSFILGWTTTSLTSGGGGASQAAVSELTARVAKIEQYLVQSGAGAPKVATKPKIEVAPKAPAPAPAATNSKANPTSKATVAKIAIDQPCKKGQTDKVLECKRNPTTKKYVWSAKPVNITNQGTAPSPGSPLSTSSATPTPTPTQSPSNP